MDPLLVRTAFDTLFRETFEGVPAGADGTWFVQGKEGLFEAMNRLSPEQASRRVGDLSSVAAHLNHTAYYISLANAEARGESPVYDWEGSWAVQEVDEHGWNAIREKLRKESKECLDRVATMSLETEDEVTALFAQLAHAAYHLGAVRQLVLLVS